MSAVLDRGELEKSPLADLHLLANELGVDGFRRLRKDDLIDAILAGQDTAPPAEERRARASRRPRSRGRASRGRGRGRGRDRRRRAPAAPRAPRRPWPRPRPHRGGLDRRGRRRASRGAARPADRTAEGVVELLGNGSGFIRLSPPEPTDDDVYISAAQVKRCELVSGDRVAGPVRPARRSERFPSLIRVDTINDRPADEVAEGTRFEDLPAAFPSERFELGSEDPTVKAIEWLTPFGKGSRVLVAGAPRAGKTEALRRLAGALAGRDGRRGLARARGRAAGGDRRLAARARCRRVLRRLGRRAGAGRGAGGRAGPARRRPRRRRRRARRHARGPAARRRAARAGGRPEHRRRRLADRDRHRRRRRSAARRRSWRSTPA